MVVSPHSPTCTHLRESARSPRAAMFARAIWWMQWGEIKTKILPKQAALATKKSRRGSQFPQVKLPFGGTYFYFIPVIILKTSLAKSIPAVGGTKEMLPGTCRLFPGITTFPI